VYRSFWIEAFEQLAAEVDGDEPVPLVPLDELLPQAASVAPMSVVAAAATMMRRI